MLWDISKTLQLSRGLFSFKLFISGKCIEESEAGISSFVISSVYTHKMIRGITWKVRSLSFHPDYCYCQQRFLLLLRLLLRLLRRCVIPFGRRRIRLNTHFAATYVTTSAPFILILFLSQTDVPAKPLCKKRKFIFICLKSSAGSATVCNLIRSEMHFV